MNEHLEALVEALISGDNEAAEAALSEAITEKTRVLLGEADEEKKDDKKDEDHDEEEHDEDDESEDDEDEDDEDDKKKKDKEEDDED